MLDLQSYGGREFEWVGVAPERIASVKQLPKVRLSAVEHLNSKPKFAGRLTHTLKCLDGRNSLDPLMRGGPNVAIVVLSEHDANWMPALGVTPLFDRVSCTKHQGPQHMFHRSVTQDGSVRSDRRDGR